jgi:hypothetical protein
VLLPLGEEEVIGPDGSAYSINWSQDDQGRLVVLSCNVKSSQQQQQQYVVLEGLQEQQSPVLLQQQPQQQQQQHSTSQQQQQECSNLGSLDMPWVQMQQHSVLVAPGSCDQGVHERHHHHHQEQQQQQQQQSGPLHAVHPAQQSSAALPVSQGGAVSEAALPRLSECIRKFSPTPGSKPHEQ